MDDTILDDWFTKTQAAAFLRVSEKTVERLATKGDCPPCHPQALRRPPFARLLPGRP